MTHPLPIDAPLSTDAPVPPQVESSLDVLLDFDQPREHKPGAAWTDQVYIGPKQYDHLFIAVTHEVESSMMDPPKGPLGDIERIELVGDGKTVLATVARSGFTYKAEPFNTFMNDRGNVSGTREHLEVRLGPAVGNYVKSTHPFRLSLRGLTATGVLVIEKTFDGDESSQYSEIVPPRPY